MKSKSSKRKRPTPTIFVFHCNQCHDEEYFTEQDVPGGDPTNKIAYCDTCNSKMEYVGIDQGNINEGDSK